MTHLDPTTIRELATYSDQRRAHEHCHYEAWSDIRRIERDAGLTPSPFPDRRTILPPSPPPPFVLYPNSAQRLVLVSTVAGSLIAIVVVILVAFGVVA